MEKDYEILDCLKSLEKVSELKESLKSEDETLLAEFETELTEAVNEATAGNEVKSLVVSLAEGKEINEELISDVELLKSCQEAALNLNSDWNEETSKLTFASYLAKGGLINSEESVLNKLVTFGELYGLEDTHELFAKETSVTNKQRSDAPVGAFCAPLKTFPVTDAVSAINASRLLENFKGDKEEVLKAVEAKANDYGLSLREGVKFNLAVIKTTEENLNLYTVSNKEEANSVLEQLETITSLYNFDESQKEQFKNFVESIISNSEIIFSTEENLPLLNTELKLGTPLELGTEFLLKFFKNNEANTESNQYLATLVGLVRKEDIAKETIDASGKGYSVFSKKVLEKLYNDHLTKTEANKEAEPVEQIQQKPIQQIVETPNTEETDSDTTPWYAEVVSS